jgi:hypothetical protein
MVIGGRTLLHRDRGLDLTVFLDTQPNSHTSQGEEKAGFTFGALL